MGYDEYIKAELFRRFPKHPSVPFYAFGNAAKADALYAAEGGWAKSHNWFSDHQLSDAAKELEGRGELSKAYTWEAIPVEKVLDFNEVFPTKSFYEGHKGSDVSSAWQQIARTSAISTLALKYTPLMRSKHPAHAAALSAASGKFTLAVPAGEAALTVWQEFQRTKDDPKWAEIAAQSGKRGLMGTSASSTPEMKIAYVPPAASPDGMQAAQAVMMQQFLTSRGNPMARMRRNPYMVTTGGQAVPQFKRQDLSTFAASGKSVQRHEEEQGQQFRITNTRPGLWEIVDARTGQPTGKYAGSAERAQEVLVRLTRRTNPHQDRGEVYEPQPFERPTAGKPQAATGPKSAHRDRRTGRVRMLTDKQAASPIYRAYQKIENNPSSGKRSSTDKALEYAVAAAMEQLHKMVKRSSAPKRRNPSPVPGISVEEVIADVQGEEWANWAYNRAGIMHYR